MRITKELESLSAAVLKRAVRDSKGDCDPVDMADARDFIYSRERVEPFLEAIGVTWDDWLDRLD